MAQQSQSGIESLEVPQRFAAIESTLENKDVKSHVS